jgi:hypothetical protein
MVIAVRKRYVPFGKPNVFRMTCHGLERDIMTVCQRRGSMAKVPTRQDNNVTGHVNLTYGSHVVTSPLHMLRSGLRRSGGVGVVCGSRLRDVRSTGLYEGPCKLLTVRSTALSILVDRVQKGDALVSKHSLHTEGVAVKLDTVPCLRLAVPSSCLSDWGLRVCLCVRAYPVYVSLMVNRSWSTSLCMLVRFRGGVQPKYVSQLPAAWSL